MLCRIQCKFVGYSLFDALERVGDREREMVRVRL